MQCPKCHYEPTMLEMQRSPKDCVKCGINYEGHGRHVESIRAARAEEERVNLSRNSSLSKSLQVNQVVTPVVIVDFDMSFFALVRLLVKVSLAAIPAMIIVAAILWFILVVLMAALRG